MSNKNISELIKKRRLEKGLSLSRLSARVNTSPATISRYENGWQRFEIYTLRKLATALNCRLHIDLIPIKEKKIQLRDNNSIKRLKRLFWDQEFNKKHIMNYPEWTVKHILEYGDIQDIKILVHLMTKKKFLKVVSKIEFASEKTSNFWQKILDRENISCTKKSFRKKVKNCWPN